MIFIGEKLNSSIPATGKAMTERDGDAILALAQAQVDSGAAFLDINTALTGEKEAETMLWIISLLKSAIPEEVGFMLDSPDPSVISQVIGSCGRHVIINSVTPEPRRFEGMVSLALEHGADLVALPTGGGFELGCDPREQFELSERLLDMLDKAGIPESRVLLDVLVRSAATGEGASACAIETTRLLRSAHPGLRLTGGVSNVSFGLPKRREINSAMLACLICAGLDAPIIDPTRPEIRLAAYAANMLAGNDEYCMDFITAVREMEDE